MRILKDQTIGLIVDVQERLFPHIHNHEQLADNISILIQGLKVLGIPLLVTQQYTKGLGKTIERIQLSLGGFSPIEKISFSCCAEPSFLQQLKSSGKKAVLIAGIESHICVQQTTIDLLDKDYTPVIIQDCISSRKENDTVVALQRMRSEGAIITTYESILFELCQYAGTDTFKSISRLVK